VIPPELVERVRESADIVQIIGEYVKLKRAGGDFRGPCPFHGGKNPNFSVSPRRAMYHCFKCQESGNVFTFLQKHLGMSFPDAVRAVASTVGIDIPETISVERVGPDPREPYWEVNATAAEYFKTQLWTDPAAAHARDYVASRHISREVADQYGLGFAPRDGAAFRTHMETLGFDEARLLDAGLLVKPDDAHEARARFRGRLMFPILDVQGRHIAFGGRALGDIEPKYLNSPETPVFSKGKTLYALNWTRNDIRKADRVFVVEGYFDAIRLMDAGLNTVVAPLGTALTDAQAALLTRYTKNVYLLYDSDAAGLKATFRAGDELLKHGAAVRVMTLPGGEDPDTFVQRHGASAIETHVTQSVDIFERKIQELQRHGYFGELHKKRRALDKMLPTIRATSDSLLRDLYVGIASEKAGIAKDVLLRELNAAERGRDRGADRMPDAPPSRAPQRARDVDPELAARDRRAGERRRSAPRPSAERELLHVMSKFPQYIPTIAERVGPDRFLNPDYRDVYEALLAWDPDSGHLTLTDGLDDAQVAILQEMWNEPDYPQDPERSMSGAITRILGRDIEARKTEINAIISVADEDQKKSLTLELQRLTREENLSGDPVNRRFKKF